MQRGGQRQVCTYFSSKGYCYYGDQCQFLHARPVSLSQAPQGRSKSAPTAHNVPDRTMDMVGDGPMYAYPQHPRSYMYMGQTGPSAKRGGASLGGRPPTQRLLHQLPMKAYPGAPGLNTPPSSKQSKSNTSPQTQVEAGGTIYFLPPDQQKSYPRGFTAPTKPNRMSRATRAPSFFTPEALRQDLLARESVCLSSPGSSESCPAEVEHYHTLCPLDAVDTTDKEGKRPFGHPSSSYRCVSSKDGLYYGLRRIQGFRVSSGKAVLDQLEQWRKLHHVNIISLKEMFTTKAFGDNSVVFVYDYHPGAESLHSRHLRNLRRTSPLPEELVWEYVVQLVSALRLVHGSNLAMQCLGASEILLSSQHRLRLNSAGIMDIVTHPSSLPTAMHQQGDLVAAGETLLCVALQSPTAASPQHFPSSMEQLATSYSPDLHHVIQYLLQSGPQGSPHSILEVLPMVGDRILSCLENSQLQQDYLEGELSKELQNGRLFRLLAKLGTVNERPEFSGDPQWSETGDRYLMKLFRDHLFHQVRPSGKPWVDLAHIVQTLNKLDAGVEENVSLHSRDEQTVLIVSYAELKTCLQSTFTEVLNTSPPITDSSP